MKTHEAKNWGELAMILTARLRLQYICTGAADKRRAAFLMDGLRYWTALYERGRRTEDGALEAACRHGIFTESEGAICSEELT